METNRRLLIIGILNILILTVSCDSKNDCKDCKLNIVKVDITSDTNVGDKLAELACDHWQSGKKQKQFSLKSSTGYFKIKDNFLYLKSTEGCPAKVTVKCSSEEFTLDVNCPTGVKSDDDVTPDGDVTTAIENDADSTTITDVILETTLDKVSVEATSSKDMPTSGESLNIVESTTTFDVDISSDLNSIVTKPAAETGRSEPIVADQIMADVAYLGNLTTRIKSRDLTQKELRQVIPEYLRTVSRLLDDDIEDVWENTEDQNGLSPVRLALEMDLFQEAVLEAGDFPKPLVTTTRNTVTTMGSITTDEEQSTAIHIQSPKHGSSSITFPAQLMPGESVVKVATTVYRSSVLNGTSGDLMVSDVVSIVTNPKTPPHLKQPIELTLSKQDDEGKTSKRIYRCTFLDFNTSSWSETGCHVEHTNHSHVTCRCSHLTNFAILMQVVDFEISSDDNRVLELLTIIGSSVSLVSITITLGVIVWLRQFTDRLLIMINLMLALGLAQAMFLAGVQSIYDRTLCQMAAVLLHYLYLAVFSLMLAEGVQLYQKLYRAMADGLRIRYLLIAAWGCPVIIVAVTLGVRLEDYGTSNSCWLSLKHGTIWAFVGPALFVILVNVIVLCLVLRVYVSVRINARKSQFAKIRSSFKAALVLLPLIGLTWIFGVMAMSTSTIVFQYFFAILNSFQGFFIFLFHVVMNSDIKDSFKKKTEKITKSRSWFTVSSSSSSGKMYFAKQNAVTPILVSSASSDSRLAFKR